MNTLKIKLLFLSLLTTLSFSGAHAIPPASRIIAEEVTNVGFAAPDFVGIFKFQVLENGEMLYIDNKNVITSVGTLSGAIVTNVKKEIDGLALNKKLEKQTGPECTDAPTANIYVYNSNNQKNEIKKTIACIDYLSPEYPAQSLADWITQLSSAMQQYLKATTPERK